MGVNTTYATTRTRNSRQKISPLITVITATAIATVTFILLAKMINTIYGLVAAIFVWIYTFVALLLVTLGKSKPKVRSYASQPYPSLPPPPLPTPPRSVHKEPSRPVPRGPAAPLRGLDVRVRERYRSLLREFKLKEKDYDMGIVCMILEDIKRDIEKGRTQSAEAKIELLERLKDNVDFMWRLKKLKEEIGMYETLPDTLDLS